MEHWILEAAQATIAGIVIVYVFYTMAFSAREDARREQSDNLRRSRERRDIERRDRRGRNAGPPRGAMERRIESRRSR